MKRTLTAAAVLVGSAGALGFAGTANAAEARAFPAELPVDNNNVADAAYHLAGTVDSATRVVGDVVPAEKAITTRAGDESPVGSLTSTVMDSSVNDVLGWVAGDEKPAGAQEKPAETASSAPQGRSDEALLLDGELNGGKLPNVVDGVAGTVPSLVGETLPAQPSPAKGEARTGLTDGTPLEGALPPVTAEPHAVVGQLSKVLDETPLSGMVNLGQ